jgi:hypothetical protein
MSFLDNSPNYVIITLLIILFYNISLFVGAYAGDL